MEILTAFYTVLWRVAIYHLIPASILSLTSLLFVLGIIKVCRVKRPLLRGTLFFIALLKPLFVLIQGTFPGPVKIYAPIALSLQLPDPMNFIPAHLWHIDIQLLDTNMGISLILILAAVSLFLCWRWRSYYIFCHGLSQQSSSGYKGKKELFDILTELRKKIGTPARLLITKIEYESPFSVGARDPLMVFPSYILGHLTKEEKKAVLAHELVHIRERDTLRQWIPVILKDLLLFSPFAHFSFAKICMEREKRVDQAAANHLNNPTSLASALLKTAKLMTEPKKTLPMTQSFLAQTFLKPGAGLTERVKALVDFGKKRNHRLSWAKRILIGIGIALLLYVQVFVSIRVLSYMIQIF